MARIVKKPTERRAEILKTARDLFLTKEYDKTTMQDVMDHLGIAKGTIYHYFDSKEALLEAIVIDMVNTKVAEMEALLRKSKKTALEKIKEIALLGNMAKGNEKILAPLHSPSNSAMHIRILSETVIKLAPIYEKLIRQGCDEGIFQTEYPLECAEFLLSGVQLLTDTGIYPWTEKDLKRRAQAFPKLIEQLLEAPQGSFQFMKHL
jgi:AcrR family transcriptional regulator